MRTLLRRHEMTPSQAISGNGIRTEIVAHLAGSEGFTDYFSHIKKKLKLNNGSINYHLYVLEKKDVIASKTDGRRKWYRLKDPAFIASPVGDTYKEIIRTVDENEGGLRCDEIANNVGSNRGNLSNKLSKLVQKGRICYDPKNRRYYPVSQPGS